MWDGVDCYFVAAAELAASGGFGGNLYTQKILRQKMYNTHRSLITFLCYLVMTCVWGAQEY